MSSASPLPARPPGTALPWPGPSHSGAGTAWPLAGCSWVSRSSPRVFPPRVTVVVSDPGPYTGLPRGAGTSRGDSQVQRPPPLCLASGEAHLLPERSLTHTRPRSYLTSATRPRTPAPPRWARLCWTCRTSSRWPEWCTPAPQVGPGAGGGLQGSRAWAGSVAPAGSWVCAPLPPVLGTQLGQRQHARPGRAFPDHQTSLRAIGPHPGPGVLCISQTAAGPTGAPSSSWLGRGS